MKTLMKKTVALLLAVCLVACLLPATAFAVQETAPTVAVGSASVRVGDTVSVPVTISGNPGIAGVELEVLYDEDLLELTNISEGDLLNGDLFIPNVEAGRIVWADLDEMTKDGTLVWLEFTALGKVDGSCEVSVQAPAASRSAFKNLDGVIEDGEFTFESGTVTVNGYKPVVSVDSIIRNSDGTASVPVRIADNPGIAGMELEIVYDEEFLELIDITTDNGAILTKGVAIPNIEGGKFVWANDSEITDDGILFWMVFEVLEEEDEEVAIEDKIFDVSVQTPESSGNAFMDTNGALDDSMFTFEPGSVIVKGKEVVSGSIRFTGGSVTYNGKHQQPKNATISGVKASGTVVWTYLFERVDGEETYPVDEMVNAGSYLVYAVYEDDTHYGISDPVSFVIKPKSITIAGATVTSTVYDGDTELDPELVTAVTFKSVITGDEVEYTVTRAVYNSADAGSKTVTIDVTLAEGGNYTFSSGYTTTYKSAKGIILKKEAIVTVDPVEDQLYTGTKLTPALTVRYGEIVLTAGTDYKVVYSNNTNVGTASATLTFTSKNYDLQLDPSCEEITFRIVPADPVITAISDLVVSYTGELPSASGIKGTANFGGKKITGTWEWVNAEEDLGVDAGVYENVAVRFVPDNENLNAVVCDGTISVTVEPAVISISGVVVADKEYDGTVEVDPELVTEVLFGNVTLVKDVDYRVVRAYYKDAKVGTGKTITVDVELLGNPNVAFAKGALTATYAKGKGNIIGRILDDVTVEGAPDEMAYTGSAVTFANLVVTGWKGGEEFVLTKDTDYKITYANNVDIGYGTATITVVGTNYSYAEPIVLEFEIRSPEEGDFLVDVKPVSVVYSGKALTGSALSGTVTLSGKKITGKWSWAESVNTVAELTNAHEEMMVSAIFTITDSFAQFVEGGVLEVEVPVTIAPKTLTVSSAALVVEYGDPVDEAEVTVVFSGAVKGDVVGYEAWAAGELSDPNVGKSKTVPVSVELLNPNYCFSGGVMELFYEKGKGEVTRKTVEVFVEDLPAMPYTAANITPEVTATFTADGEPVEVTYKLTYKNNKAVGTASVTMTCTDKNYIFDTQQLTFVIEKAKIDISDLVLDDVVTTYSGKVPAATLITAKVMNAAGKAVAGKWTWSVEPGVAAGSYDAEALFVPSDKNFEVDPIPVTVVVQQKEISISAVKLAKSEYNFGDPTATITSITFKGIISKDVVDYEAEACYADGEVGTKKAAVVTVWLAEDGNYVFADGTYVAEYTKATGQITKKTLTITVNGVPESMDYTGDPITFNELIEVYDEELGLLVEGVDYKVTYSNNTKAGTSAKVTITCINSNYTFTTVSKTFKIVK